MEEKIKCPKCGGDMEKGVVPNLGMFETETIQKWTKVIKRIQFRWSPSLTKDVVTFRCISCGFLESYAK